MRPRSDAGAAASAGHLADLMSRHARIGRLERILLRPARRAQPREVGEAALGPGGLDGDHARPGPRALTLIQAEHLPVIKALSDREELSADDLAPLLRRNLVVSAINLASLRGRRVRIGPEAIVEITTACAPCSRMEAALGHGGHAAMRGHGGWCATVIRSGPVGLHMQVRPDSD